MDTNLKYEDYPPDLRKMIYNALRDKQPLVVLMDVFSYIERYTFIPEEHTEDLYEYELSVLHDLGYEI